MAIANQNEFPRNLCESGCRGHIESAFPPSLTLGPYSDPARGPLTSRAVQSGFRLRICITFAEVFGSQYAAHASINLRRFSSASLLR